ncbi:Taurine-binding periplasmic protein precursor [compost metagenome]
MAKIARLTGSKPEEVTALLPGNIYPSLAEQSKLLQQPLVKAVGDTAAFLKSQGKVDSLQPSYTPYVTNQFINAALR